MANQPLLTPAVINAKMVFRIGTVLWGLGLLVLGVLHLCGISVPGRYPIISISGITFGALGYWWAHRNHLIGDDGFSEEQRPAGPTGEGD